MSALSPANRTKLARMLGLLGSDHAGERDAAGIAATWILKAAGVSWEDVLHSDSVRPHPLPPNKPKPAQAQAQASGSAARDAAAWSNLQFCTRHKDGLSGWESRFVQSLSILSRWSQAQRLKLAEISAELRSKGLT